MIPKKRKRSRSREASVSHRSESRADWQFKIEAAKKASRAIEPPASSSNLNSDVLIQDQEWNKNERKFHLEQSRLRSRLRIEQSRPTKFDTILYFHMLIYEDLDIRQVKSDFLPEEIRRPYSVLESSSATELQSIMPGIEVHFTLEHAEKADYWHYMQQICEWELVKKRAKEEAEERGVSHFNICGISSEMLGDIEKVLTPKDLRALKDMENSVKGSLADPNFSMDREYWEGMLKLIHIQQAKLHLEKLSEEYLSKLSESSQVALSSLQIQNTNHAEDELHPLTGDGSMSPILISEDDSMPFSILSEEQDIENYNLLRKSTLEAEIQSLKSSKDRFKVANPLLSSESGLYSVARYEKLVSGKLENTVEDLMRIELLKQNPLQDDEEEFGESMELKPVLETWRDKFRPRKPKYFNRIKTGYEWNKYNQTHFDHLNPPPKVVQGYKFNIFYPDLIDKTKAPQFYLEPSESSETCIIRFHAGPPYEDIAFKIVNREWDYSDRHGFKCFFDKGVMHLYFNFKRHRYKR
jgi:hypothetical protein